MNKSKGLPSVPGAKEVFPVSQDEETEQLWQDVEKFLNRPGPSIKTLPGAPKTYSLPSLRAEVKELKRHGPKPPKPSSGRKKPGTGRRKSKKEGNSEDAIDPSLLQQAFSYTGKPQYKVKADDLAASAGASARSTEPKRVGVRTPSPLVYEPSTAAPGAGGRSAAPGSAAGGVFVLSSSTSGSTTGGGGGGSRPGQAYTAAGGSVKARSSSAPGHGAPRQPKVKRKGSGKNSKAFGAYAAPVLGSASAKATAKAQRQAAAEAGWNGNTSTAARPTKPRRKKGGSSGGAARTKGLSAQEMNDLANDLASGATVEALRKQLETSQQSLASSNAFLHKARKQWFTEE